MISAHAFIDWDTARRIRRPPGGLSENIDFKDRVRYVSECYQEIQQRTVDCLSGMQSKSKVKIVMSRIYHGWHRGRTATDDRRAWEEAKSKLRPVANKNVSFLADIRFGDSLICGGLRSPLFDTLRRRDDGLDQQKMVDTALVADLLSYCRAESAGFRRGRPPEAMAIVIANDDDLLPGTFAAEQWGLPVKVMRINRANESKFLQLDGLVYSL
ncbi:hypothetical protein ABQZ69_17650 [Xanthomonas sp. WHRI 8391]|uniref:hypothetical protein n=1 Tax=Xanthomonas TaxID=338 RepID=UPI001A2DB00D|nr:hypothetical protein [Xanthomonas hortorum]MBG3851686.1 hypothetical protein [Xanthomonas hortorum pv. carotae]UTS73739.1 hypothetical protein NMB96_02450 [Xanthomonas hortorum]